MDIGIKILMKCGDMDSSIKKKKLIPLPLLGGVYRTNKCNILLVYGVLSPFGQNGLLGEVLIYARSSEDVHVVPISIWNKTTTLIEA